jgi:hypothetical protein
MSVRVPSRPFRVPRRFPVIRFKKTAKRARLLLLFNGLERREAPKVGHRDIMSILGPIWRWGEGSQAT